MVEVVAPSLAKLNLDLRVLHKRADSFHELRTIFQTISLRDELRIGFESQKSTSVHLKSSVDIPDNLVLRAVRLVCERLKVRGRIRLTLKKEIPMGAGLGGGSSNAATVLMALPTLAGLRPSAAVLAELAAELGSDVPFFLHGGTALGCGRGTELYPLPDQPSHPVLVVSTGIHISTSEAYRLLNRSVTNALTSLDQLPMLREFQALVWSLNTTPIDRLALANDFEKPVFDIHRPLAAVVRKLRRLGARRALMTGSGSAVFGVFSSTTSLQKAAQAFHDFQVFPARFVSRRQYQTLWRRALRPVDASTPF